MQRYITLWRRYDRVLDWDHYVSESLDEAETVVCNIKKNGVHQYHTYELGEAVDDLSSEY